jgi:hypothetical protein
MKVGLPRKAAHIKHEERRVQVIPSEREKE